MADACAVERPRTGTGTRSSGHRDASGAVVQLARCCERGETPPLSLILQCLDSIQTLELSSSGGDAFLWMVAPVLRAAHDRLAGACSDRATLAVEVGMLRSELERLSMDVESESGCWRRAESSAKAQLQERLEAAQKFEQKAARLLQELEQVKAETQNLQRQADEGLAIERAERGREQEAMEEQILHLSDENGKLDQKLNLDLNEAIRRIEKQLVAAKDKLTQLNPRALKQDELARKVDSRETNIAEAQSELELLETELKGRRRRRAPSARRQ